MSQNTIPPRSRVITDKRVLGALGLRGAATVTPVGASVLIWDSEGSTIAAAGPASAHFASLGSPDATPERTGYVSEMPGPQTWPGAQSIDDTTPRDGETPEAWWARVAGAHGWAEWIKSQGLAGNEWAGWARLLGVVSPTTITDALKERLAREQPTEIPPPSTTNPATAVPTPGVDGSVP